MRGGAACTHQEETLEWQLIRELEDDMPEWSLPEFTAGVSLTRRP
jgi:hypothetical protein